MAAACRIRVESGIAADLVRLLKELHRMSAPIPSPKPPGAQSAREAGLYYASDADPGITRVKIGRAFGYRGVDGRPVRDRATLERIRSLVIPPAWEKVWIAPKANAHLQATGRDARGRKQYRYHPRWTAVRDETKYTRMLAFARVLPAIRRRVAADLRRTPLSRERVLATVVALLERTLIRVGNDEYARTNGSFGLTTLLDRHVDVRGRRVRFRFRAKSGVMQKIDLEDALLARSVQRCQDLPGQTLFQYVDETGAQRTISSTDVNGYIREIAGQEFTAKDFRTWSGTVLAACALCSDIELASATARKRFVSEAIGDVASRLGNTKAVCRKCYVHPTVIDAFLDGDTIAPFVRTTGTARSRHQLSAEEAAVVKLLTARLEARTKRRAA
jgi:DNA topoisomerase-1